MRNYRIVYVSEEKYAREIEIWYSRYGHNQFDIVRYTMFITDAELHRFLDDIQETIKIAGQDANVVKVAVK